MRPVFFEAALESLPDDRDERILFALRTLGFSGTGCVARTETGKPFLPDCPNLFFSVSHSGERYVCAAADRPIGIDLQRRAECSRERLARRIFHPDEVAYLAERGWEPFFAVWTARESFVKCCGTGLFHEPQSFCAVRNGGISAPDGFSLHFRESGPDWWLAVTLRNEKI